MPVWPESLLHNFLLSHLHGLKRLQWSVVVTSLWTISLKRYTALWQFGFCPVYHGFQWQWLHTWTWRHCGQWVCKKGIKLRLHALNFHLSCQIDNWHHNPVNKHIIPAFCPLRCVSVIQDIQILWCITVDCCEKYVWTPGYFVKDRVNNMTL